MICVKIGTLEFIKSKSCPSGYSEFSGSLVFNESGGLNMIASTDAPYLREKTTQEKNAGAIDDLIVDIKREAQDRIYVVLPAWKQANYTARSIELLEKKGTVGLTVEEDGEIAFFKSQFELTKAIRAASNVIEAALIVSADPSAFNVSAAFDAALSNQ